MAVFVNGPPDPVDEHVSDAVLDLRPGLFIITA